MSEHEANQHLGEKFDAVVAAIMEQLAQQRRDPNAVLDAQRNQLRVRLLAKADPAPEWFVWPLLSALASDLEPWQIAGDVLSSWNQRTSANE